MQVVNTFGLGVLLWGEIINDQPATLACPHTPFSLAISLTFLLKSSVVDWYNMAQLSYSKVGIVRY